MSNQSSKVKAVIFDCFGVLATDGWLPFKDKYFKNDPELFMRATQLNRMVDSGLESYDNFLSELASMAGIKSSEARNQIENNVPNAELFVYINKYLRPGYKLGILSNAGANWLGHIFTAEQTDIFDAVVLSFEVGAVKPAPILYTTIAAKLNLSLGECVFIDDKERYCEGAIEVGMQALRYETVEKLTQELNAILGIN